MTEDQQLLQKYVRDAAPDALNELVRRYRDLVYSSASRQVRDAHLAEDVAQAVFIVLSQKASTIRQGVALGGWLLAVTRRIALNARKRREIHLHHERAAAKAEAIETVEGVWEQIVPLLDDVMSHLPRLDRDAVVLRFFQQRSFVDVGAELGLSEEAARKRVGRAIERMRGLFRRKGVSVGAAALGTTIASHSVRAAPATIAVSTSASATSLAKGAITVMRLSQLKAFAVATAMFLLISGGALLVMTAMAEQPEAAAQNHPAPTTAPFNADAAREGILLRFQSLQNFSVSYQIESVNPLADAQTKSGSDVSERSLMRRGDQIRSELKEQRLVNAQDTVPAILQKTVVRTDSMTESLTEETRRGVTSRSGAIEPNRSVSSDMVEWMLKLGSDSPVMKLNIADILTMDISQAPNGNVMLRQADDKAASEWKFRPDMGYALVAYRRFVLPETQPNVEATAEDFKTVKGIELPYKITMRSASRRNGQWTDTQRQVAKIHEYNLNDPQNTDDRYHIKWPAGTKVMDMRNNNQFIAGDDGKLIPVGK